MEPVRPLRDVFADLAGTDGGQAREALTLAGHEELPDDLVSTAIAGYAGTAPAEVAEHLAPFVAGDGVPAPADGLALLTTAPTGPWDDEVPLDGADGLDAADGFDDVSLDDAADLDGGDDAGLDELDAADRLDGTDAPATDAPGTDDGGLDATTPDVERATADEAAPFGAGHTGGAPVDTDDTLDRPADVDGPDVDAPADLLPTVLGGLEDGQAPASADDLVGTDPGFGVGAEALDDGTDDGSDGPDLDDAG
jgi:hypothetical protein